MIIKNLTKKTQKLWIKNIFTGDTAEVDVLATEPRELGRAFIPDKSMMKDFDQRFEMVGYPRQQIVEKEQVIVQESIQEEIMDPPVEETQEPETLESKFICDICGEEFASARGLTAHKNRSHKE